MRSVWKLTGLGVPHELWAKERSADCVRSNMISWSINKFTKRFCSVCFAQLVRRDKSCGRTNRRCFSETMHLLKFRFVALGRCELFRQDVMAWKICNLLTRAYDEINHWVAIWMDLWEKNEGRYPCAPVINKGVWTSPYSKTHSAYQGGYSPIPSTDDTLQDLPHILEIAKLKLRLKLALEIQLYSA